VRLFATRLDAFDTRDRGGRAAVDATRLLDG
jgi:hypothetical protein